MKKCLILFCILVTSLVIASIMDIEETTEEQQIATVDDFRKLDQIELELAGE